MANLNRKMVLNSLIRHETLTLVNLANMVNPGTVPEENHLRLLLNELLDSGYIHLLSGVTPSTYTITNKGIREGKRLVQESQNS